jgi:tRNA(Ser,Leu) C12 N-acetylase TAN1
MSKNKPFNVILNNGKQVKVRLDKSDDTYDVQGGGAGYSTIENIKKCKFLNKDLTEPEKSINIK